MTTPDDLAVDATGVATLADPVRRALYLFVSRERDAVSRERAATAAQVPVHTAKFHLDKLAAEGLLDVEFRRLSGRSGPGAGRPSKLYRRSAREIAVSLPERHYDLLGRILASGVEHAIGSRSDVAAAVADVARREGQAVGARASRRGGELSRTAAALEETGYEPRVVDRLLLLENCPFHRLAQDHTELVCSVNLAYVGGVIEGLGCQRLTATLEPGQRRCCVVASLDR